MRNFTILKCLPVHQVEVEGVFVESNFQDSKLKKISAPTIDLANSSSQDDLDDSVDVDENNAAGENILSPSSENGTKATENGFAFPENGNMSDRNLQVPTDQDVPSILITRTESSMEDGGDMSGHHTTGTTDTMVSAQDFDLCEPATEGKITSFLLYP